jgi:hypothetical protein
MATLSVTTNNHGSPTLDIAASAVAVDVGGSDKWLNTGNELIVIQNGNGSSCVVTENYGTGGTIDGQTLPAKTATIATTKFAILGPFNPGLYNDANGYCTLAWSVTTSVKVLVVLKGS